MAETAGYSIKLTRRMSKTEVTLAVKKIRRLWLLTRLKAPAFVKTNLEFHEIYPCPSRRDSRV
jgi:hypothetical protein